MGAELEHLRYFEQAIKVYQRSLSLAITYLSQEEGGKMVETLNESIVEVRKKIGVRNSIHDQRTLIRNA